MKSNPLVCIVVPVYNVEKYLEQCMESLVNQTYRNIQIICVDDGSPDKSIDILNHYAAKDSRVKVVTKVNGGLSDARNYGMRYVSGKYFMFIDSDDWLDLSACEESVRTAENNDADCVMFSYTKEFSNTQVPVHVFKNTELGAQHPGFEHVIGGGYLLENQRISNFILQKTFGPVLTQLRNPHECDITVSAWMQLFKTELFKDIKFYDNRKLGTFEDGVYQIDVYSRCKRFVYIDRPWYHYRKTNAASITSKYNPNLHLRWKGLFKLLYEKSENYATNDEERILFDEAVNNRIALSILPLGLNVVRANKSIKDKSKILSEILSDETYEQSLNKLPLQYLSLPWRVIFKIAKNKNVLLLTGIFSLIEYLRTHGQR